MRLRASPIATAASEIDAISEYGEAIAIDPDHAVVRVLRGQAFNKAHARLREADRRFFQSDPDPSETRARPMSAAAPLAML